MLAAQRADRALPLDDRARPAVRHAEDGGVARRLRRRAAGAQQWLTGPLARERVRDLRVEHDAVMVGAGTIRVDDPQLTVRPHATRRKPYARVVVCETDAIPATSRVLAPPPDAPPDAYGATIVLAPRGARAKFAELEPIAEVVYVGDEEATQLDLAAALVALRARDIASVLCEGGPTLAGRLLAGGLVQRVVWLIAPTFLRTETAVPALAGARSRRRERMAVRPHRTRRRRHAALRRPQLVFSGLIAHDGRVASVEGDARRGMTSSIEAPDAVAAGVALGDSVAVNGACLTVVAFDATTMRFDVVPETVARDRLRHAARRRPPQRGALAAAGRPARRPPGLRSRRCQRVDSRARKRRARVSVCTSCCPTRSRRSSWRRDTSRSTA